MKTSVNSARYCLILLLLTVSSTIAADGMITSPQAGWSQWRGPRRDGISEETGLLTQWPDEGPQLLWKTKDLGKGWSSPVITNDRIYLTGDIDDDLVIFALDINGESIWQTKNGKSWKNPYPGARASCAVSQGRLYNMNAHGRVTCLDANTGKQLWAVNILERFDAKNITWALSECLLIDGPRLIVTPGGKNALMAALDKKTGKTVWTTPPPIDDKTSHCSPILFQFADRRIIANCSASQGFGVDAETGKLLWTVPVKNRFGTNISTPIYGSGHIYFVTPYTHHGRVYRLTATDQGLTAQHIWTSEKLDSVTGSGVLVDDTLFTAGYKKHKWWFAVDWKSGKIKYELKELTTGAAIYADNHLYCLDEKGNIALVKPTTERFEIKGRFKIETGRYKDAWAHPVLLDGKLYIRHHETLYCYDVKKKTATH